MNQITLTESTLEVARIAELVQNFHKGIDLQLGVSAERFEHCANNYADNKEFKNYLLKNDEAELYLKIAGNPTELTADIARQLFKQSPDGYVDLLNRYHNRNVPINFRTILDSHFQEIAPLAKRFIQGRYLPECHRNNRRLILTLTTKQICYAAYIESDDFLIEAVEEQPNILEAKHSDVTGSILLMRKLCKANHECAQYASYPITKKAGVTSSDSKTEKVRKVNAWLEATGDRKLINNASGGGMPRVKTAALPKTKFKI